MSNDNPYIPNPPIPESNPSKEADNELVLKEDFNQNLLKSLNAGNKEFILPDDVEVKEKKKKE